MTPHPRSTKAPKLSIWVTLAGRTDPTAACSSSQAMACSWAARQGAGPLFPENQPLDVLRQAMEEQTVLEGVAIRCDGKRDLTVRFGG